MTSVAKSPPTPLFQRGENPAAILEPAFRQIAATRMAGVSLLNAALQVEAVGFRHWRDDWIGVLITPWFMSLICLPGPDASREPMSSGTRIDVALPAGDYEFLFAHEEALGHYLTSSLFSPMFEFADMAQAREVAEAVLVEVFKPAETQPPPPAPAASVGLTAKLEQPLSRRGFFGALLRPGSPDA